MTIHRGSADDLSMIESESIDCMVTSPPYWGLRSYGEDPNELGVESLIEYVRRMVLIMREVRRTMKPDAVAWLNLGDTSAGSGGAGGDHSSGSKQHITTYRQGAPINLLPMLDADLLSPGWTFQRAELADGQVCLVPYLVALYLQGDGWFVRNVITWDKKRHGRESLAHVRRHGRSTETILMLTKSMRYRFFEDQLTEKGNVWHFSPGTSQPELRHFAPFPDELPRRCIEACTTAGDVVLDPFSGSGTTIRVAEEMGRKGVGVELYLEEAP